MKSVTVFLAMGLLLAAALSVPAATSEPTTSASEPTTTASTEPTTAAGTEPATSTSEPTTAATTEPATASTSEPATASTTGPATAPSEPPVATMPAARPSAVKAPAATFDDYRIVFERNIFLKDRTPRVARNYWRPSRPTTQASQPVPHGLVLTGVAIRQEVSVAFFEDDQTGDLTKAVVGDVLPGGKVASISLDGVELSQGRETRKIGIGESLLGGGSVDMSSVHSSETTAGPADSSSSGSDDILERMKKRRAKELKP